MCGIAGIIGEATGAQALIAAIAHRGPNGIRVEESEKYSLAHARLSIIDLEGGWQPLHAAGSTIIANGEIYNYVELAEDFQLGPKLNTGSDFEPLLHIYAQEGEAAFDRLRGMYAFCLIGCDGRTWLVRDPFGIKPLYIHARNGAVAFSSEPRSFGQAHVVPAISNQVAALHYTLENETAWPGVIRLEPGEIIEIIDGKPVRHRVRTAIPSPLWGGVGVGVRAAASEEEALQQLDRVLEDSIKVHQRSDVPYGLFLSGGIDSATVATMMARLNTRPVVAYTCGFDAPDARDERAQAERVARQLNLDWNNVSFGEEDFWAIVPQVAWAMDDPVADYACLPTYKLAQQAKSRLTVVLTGEGGDELFGGYSRYRRAQRPKWLGGRVAEPQTDALLGSDAINKWRDASRLERAAPAAHAARSAALGPSNMLLAAGLLFGALGDALLAWSPDTFIFGAFAFLIGHLFYITLWLRAGIGIPAALKQPPRLLAALALIAACIGMTYLLVPRDNAMFAPLAVYTAVLTLMALCSFTLPTTRWLVMIGAVLFFISDGFVAWNMFHHDPDPTLAYWRSFAGWIIYWAGQAAICFGALGLHKPQPK